MKVFSTDSEGVPMFPEMRRRRQGMTNDEVAALLCDADYGILAVHGADGYPYTVPMNYVFVEGGLDGTAELGAVYFHCALEGHKLDAIAHDPKACFCVVGQHAYRPQKFATTYESVIAFGQVNIIEKASKTEALYKLSKKFDPHEHDLILNEIEKDGPNCEVLELRIDHLTSKKSPDLM